MAFVLVNRGEVAGLKRLINQRTPDDCKLRLYSNDLTPVEGTLLSGVTELVQGGYAAKTLTGANWAVTMVGATARATYAQYTWNLTGACTSYGYYLTCSGDAVLLLAERFTSAPFVLPSGGGSIKVTPLIDMD
jgi:hypothetical protein